MASFPWTDEMLASHQAGKDAQKVKDAWAVAYETGVRNAKQNVYAGLYRDWKNPGDFEAPMWAISGEWHEYLSGLTDQWMRAASQ